MTGVLQPIFPILLADVIGLYGDYNCAVNKLIRNFTDETFVAHNNLTYNISEIINEQELCQENVFMSKIHFYSGMFCLLGFGNLIGFSGSMALLGYGSGKMTTRLKTWCFEKILNFEIGFFDESNNTIGALTTRLSNDASDVQSATGSRKVFNTFFNYLIYSSIS